MHCLCSDVIVPDVTKVKVQRMCNKRIQRIHKLDQQSEPALAAFRTLQRVWNAARVQNAASTNLQRFAPYWQHSGPLLEAFRTLFTAFKTLFR